MLKSEEDTVKDNFKPVFKYYKRRQPQPNLNEVVDLYAGNEQISSLLK